MGSGSEAFLCIGSIGISICVRCHGGSSQSFHPNSRVMQFDIFEIEYITIIAGVIESRKKSSRVKKNTKPERGFNEGAKNLSDFLGWAT